MGCVLLGGYLGAGLDMPRLWIAALTVAALMAAANVINDCLDLEYDRINKPLRPLPSNQLRLDVARIWGAILIVLGLGTSMFLGADMAIVAAAMAVLSYLYSKVLKKLFLLGNIAVSVMVATTIVYGGMAVDNVGPTLVPALIILMFMFCREVLKTVEDQEGDRLMGARTIAVVWGEKRALGAFSALSVLVALVSLLPWLLNQVSALYLVIVIPGGNVILLLAAYMLLKRPDQGNIKMALMGTKAASFIWLVAMFVGLTFVV